MLCSENNVHSQAQLIMQISLLTTPPALEGIFVSNIPIRQILHRSKDDCKQPNYFFRIFKQRPPDLLSFSITKKENAPARFIMCQGFLSFLKDNYELYLYTLNSFIELYLARWNSYLNLSISAGVSVINLFSSGSFLRKFSIKK